VRTPGTCCGEHDVLVFGAQIPSSLKRSPRVTSGGSVQIDSSSPYSTDAATGVLGCLRPASPPARLTRHPNRLVLPTTRAARYHRENRARFTTIEPRTHEPDAHVTFILSEQYGAGHLCPRRGKQQHRMYPRRPRFHDPSLRRSIKFDARVKNEGYSLDPLIRTPAPSTSGDHLWWTDSP
jgi:hypothetical protein